MRTLKKFRCLGFSKITSSLRNQYLSFEFGQRSTRVAKKVTKLTTTEVRLPFRNVARDRDGCAPHLIGQTVGFSLRETLQSHRRGRRPSPSLSAKRSGLCNAVPLLLQLTATTSNSALGALILILRPNSGLASPIPCSCWVLGTRYYHPECLMCMTSPSCTM